MKRREGNNKSYWKWVIRDWIIRKEIKYKKVFLQRVHSQSVLYVLHHSTFSLWYLKLTGNSTGLKVVAELLICPMITMSIWLNLTIFKIIKVRMMKKNLEILIEDSFTTKASVDLFREIHPEFMSVMKRSSQSQGW